MATLLNVTETQVIILYIYIQTIIHDDFLNFYIKLCAPLHMIFKNILSFKNPTSC